MTTVAFRFFVVSQWVIEEFSGLFRSWMGWKLVNKKGRSLIDWILRPRVVDYLLICHRSSFNKKRYFRPFPIALTALICFAAGLFTIASNLQADFHFFVSIFCLFAVNDLVKNIILILNNIFFANLKSFCRESSMEGKNLTIIACHRSVKCWNYIYLHRNLCPVYPIIHFYAQVHSNFNESRENPHSLCSGFEMFLIENNKQKLLLLASSAERRRERERLEVESHLKTKIFAQSCFHLTSTK